MLTPSLLLTDRGNGPETIQVVATTYPPDFEGTPVPTPGTAGPPIPAVVTRMDGTALEAGGTTDAAYSFKVMLICQDDPGITGGTPGAKGGVGTMMYYTDRSGAVRTLTAVTGATLRAPQAWTCGANEVEGT